MINWRALDNIPLLLYILAAKTLLLCLAFAGAKLYQQKKEEAALKQQMTEHLEMYGLTVTQKLVQLSNLQTRPRVEMFHLFTWS
ncbi:hypothetical protein Q7C36_021785 [Tachysurus vachellii]|uniref:Uncharacterized protein n=1 Tax=Tachysurus vachellii TaxID=175792 RepID=A0AA88LIP7_TACVA|nr:hypothetical protein Q7C36_021785 [Tachysurus vachellii]